MAHQLEFTNVAVSLTISSMKGREFPLLDYGLHRDSCPGLAEGLEQAWRTGSCRGEKGRLVGRLLSTLRSSSREGGGFGKKAQGQRVRTFGGSRTVVTTLV